MSSTPSTYQQAYDLLCYEQIGRGMSRTVWSSKLLPGSVIKVEDDAGKFQNVMEWEIWQRVIDLGVSHWFAECQHISPNGSILIMERTRPAAPQEFPAKLPAFLGDFKPQNFGMVKTKGRPRFVCHDYGFAWATLTAGLRTKRMVKPDWSERS